MEETDVGGLQARMSAGRVWLQEQELSLANTFLAEGREELPVDDYLSWRGAQQRRLGQARVEWAGFAAEKGWFPHRDRSLSYLRPDLVGEYDTEHEDNPPDLAFTESVTSTRSVWWRCARDADHRWRTSFFNRHVVGTGCPRCAKKGISRREQEIYTALRSMLPELQSPAAVPRHAHHEGGRRLRDWRVDMLLPGTVPVVVEYDGAYWHQDRLAEDHAKTADLTASGHLVVRIRETPLQPVTNSDVECPAHLSAADAAALVYTRICELTPLSVPKAPPVIAATQLDLFETLETVPDCSLRPVGSQTAAIVAREALLAAHALDVAMDRNWGSRLHSDRTSADLRRSAELAMAEARGGFTSLRSLLESLRRLTQPASEVERSRVADRGVPRAPVVAGDDKVAIPEECADDDGDIDLRTSSPAPTSHGTG